MTVRRLLKAGEAIRSVVSMAILTEVRDPRVKNVTVLGVEVAPDMREAKVIISIMGNKTQQATALRGLKNSAGFLQSKIADRIDSRYTPRLSFVVDDGVKKSLAVNQILEQIAAERKSPKGDNDVESEVVEDQDDDGQLVDEAEVEDAEADNAVDAESLDAADDSDKKPESPAS